MIGAVPWSPAWQGLLNGIGWIIAKLYEAIPSYGLTIILLTVAIRVVLLPLGIKQIRSMQQMQAIQPKVKAIQQKFKGNRQKQQEETMKLYKEYGVNPFSGCWPMLLQFPILISMYSVLRYPQHPPHLPADSALRTQIEAEISGKAPVHATGFLGTNMLCSALQAGGGVVHFADPKAPETTINLNCGKGVPVRIPYFVLAVLMFGTTYFQQRQMQKATPQSAQGGQQQALMKAMPLLFGVFGFTFPAGLVLYWTTSNIWQIGQQFFMLRASGGEPVPAASDGAKKRPARRGFMASLMERAETDRARRDQGKIKKPTSNPKSGPPKNPSPPRKSGPGGGSGGNRKKRPKR